MPHLHTDLATSLLVDNEGNKDRYVRPFSLSGQDQREKYLGPVLTAETLVAAEQNY